MKKLIALALVSSLALAACGSDSSTTEETVVDTTMAEEMMMDDIVAVASATEGFATLVAAVAAAGLVETLQGEGPFTVFAPTDDAFNAVNASQPEVLECLGNNTDQLKDLLLYHVIKGSFKSDDLGGVEEPYGLIETLNGETIFVTDDGSLKVNDIAVVEPFNKTVENGKHLIVSYGTYIYIRSLLILF